MANETWEKWFGVPSKIKKSTPKKTTKKKAIRKGPSVIQQFEKVEDTNDDMNFELKKLKRMIKPTKSSSKNYKRS